MRSADTNGQLLGYLEGILSPLPEFSIWARLMYLEGKLDIVTSGTIRAGVASDPREALEYLNLLAKKNPSADLLVACCDWRGESPNRPIKRLQKLLEENGQSEKANLHLLHGAITHQVMPAIASGDVRRYFMGKERVKKQHDISPREMSRRDINQPPLFEEIGEVDPTYFCKHIGADTLNGEQHEISELVKNLAPCWHRSREILGAEGDWFLKYGNAKSVLPELMEIFYPLFGPLIDKLRKPDPYAEYLLALSLMIWAAALIQAEFMGGQILFNEIPVLGSYLGLGGGRVDALKVSSINGKPPTLSHNRILLELSSKRFRSIGQLVRDLEAVLDGEFLLEIIEWKSAVGDGVPSSKILQPGDVIKPPPKHVGQITQYLTLATLSEQVVLGESIYDTFKTESRFSRGQLIYLFPTSPQVRYEITASPAMQESFFAEFIARRWPLAEQKARIRGINNFLVGHVIKLLTKSSAPDKVTQVNGRSEITMPALFSLRESSYRDTVHSLIERYRSFVDRFGEIIEETGRGKNGRSQYLFHLDRFLTVLGTGAVKTRSFNSDRGGFVSCLMPDHEDPGPSMYISFKSGTVKCFGCGVWCVIAPSSIPKGINVEIFPEARIKKENRRTAQIIIPDAHAAIMATAQEILHASFRKSRGEEYITKERGIDKELAFELGVGFGANEFIENLVGCGYTREELMWYGFLAENSHGSQYSALIGRVTFPLTLGGKITNFYGRFAGVADAAKKHRKLSVYNTRVPHGGWNMEALLSSSNEVILTEGAFDALTLIQTGFPSTLALIGLSNIAILEEIAHSGKKTFVALDFDKPGREGTFRIIERLKECGSKEEARDFTSSFLESHPGAEKFDDFNSWLIAKLQSNK